MSSLISAGLPVAVCVWWTGSHNLLQYLLQKSPKSKPGRIIYLSIYESAACSQAPYLKNMLPVKRSSCLLFEADVEPVPDVLWPNAKEILCSAVSRCTRYIAVGLQGGLVCVWDRKSGE